MNTAATHFKNLADMQEKRDQANENNRFAHKKAQISNTLSGAVGGAMLGAELGSVTGPQGALIGAAVGYLASELF